MIRMLIFSSFISILKSENALYCSEYPISSRVFHSNFQLIRGKTICLRDDISQSIYAVTVERTWTQYSVRGSFPFVSAPISSHCHCHCGLSSDKCSRTIARDSCDDRNSSCVTALPIDGIETNGCEEGPSRTCCTYFVGPGKDLLSVSVHSPQSFFLLRFSRWNESEDGERHLLEENHHVIPRLPHQRIEFGPLRLSFNNDAIHSLLTSGRMIIDQTTNQMAWQTVETDLCFDSIRRHENGFRVRRDCLPRIIVSNCKEQRFERAEMRPFTVPDGWSVSLEFNSTHLRQVNLSVDQGRSCNLFVEKVDDHLRILSDRSQFDDFEAQFRFDRKSRKLLIISLLNVEGVIQISLNRASFSSTLYFGRFRSKAIKGIVIPNIGELEVCLQANGGEKMCKVGEYKEEVYENMDDLPLLTTFSDPCSDCNRKDSSWLRIFSGMSIFLPTQWANVFDEIRSGTFDYSQLPHYLFVLLLLFLVCYFVKKIVVPLCDCCLCPLFFFCFLRKSPGNGRRKDGGKGYKVVEMLSKRGDENEAVDV